MQPVDVLRQTAFAGASWLDFERLTDDHLHLLAWAGSHTYLGALHHDITYPSDLYGEYRVLSGHGFPVAVANVNTLWRPKTASISQLAVHPDAQSMGVGSNMIRRCENFARCSGMSHMQTVVDTQKHRAMALFTRLGYIIQERERHGLQVEGQYIHIANFQHYRRHISQ